MRIAPTEWAGFDETRFVRQARPDMSRKKKRSIRPGSSGNSRPLAPVNSAGPKVAGAVWLARGLLLVALGIAVYLSILSFSGGSVAGCGADSGCSEVLASRWSKWLGIPVSLPAALNYAVMIVITFRGLHSVNSRFLLRALCLVIFGAAAWFVGLSVFAIGKVCPYCMTAHACGVAGSGLLLAWLAGQHEKQFVKGVMDSAWATAIAVAVTGLVILIGGQLLFTPKSFRVASMGSNTNSAGLAATSMSRPIAPAGGGKLSSTGAAATNAPTTSNTLQRPPATSSTAESPAPIPSAPPEFHRTLRLHGNAFNLDLTDVPMLGSVDAEKVMISMYDYTCDHCRRAHTPIMTAQRYFSNRLAVVSLPMPLDAKCNPWLLRTSGQHENACELARLALAVWRADRKRFPEYDDWVMTSEDALKPESARKRALELVGLMALERSMVDPWIYQTLKTSTSLYRTNWLVSQSSAMPMMVIGTNIISGAMRNPDEIFRLLDEGFGLKRAP